MLGTFTSAPLPDYVFSVRVFSGGDYLVTGYHSGAGESGMFLARYTPTHELVWRRVLFQNTPEGGVGVTDTQIDANDEVVLIGVCRGSIDVGDGVQECEPDDPETDWQERDGLIVKLDSAGKTMWSRAIMGESIDTIGIDPVSREIVVGLSTIDKGPVDFGNGPVSGVYAAKLAPSGSPVWVKSVGPEGFVWIKSVAVTTTGTIVVAAGLSGNANFFGTVSGEYYEDWVGWISADGNNLGYENLSGGAGDGTVTHLTVDLAGNAIFRVSSDPVFIITGTSCGDLATNQDYLVKMAGPGNCTFAVPVVESLAHSYPELELRTDAAGDIYAAVVLTGDFGELIFGLQRWAGANGAIRSMTPWMGTGRLSGPAHVNPSGVATLLREEFVAGSYAYHIVTYTP